MNSGYVHACNNSRYIKYFLGENLRTFRGKKSNWRRREGSRDQWFWKNFIILMCGIKCWKAYENLRPVVPIEKKSQKKISFLGQNFFMCTFLIKSNQSKKRIFWFPIRIFEKRFFSSFRVNVCFLWTKKYKMQTTTLYFVKRFSQQILEFHRPSKIVCQTPGRQNYWSL